MVSVAVLFRPSTSDITRWCDFAQLPSQSTKFLKYKKGHSGVYPGDLGRFPFDQIFRFQIPGILCDEWNSIFRLVGLTNPRSSGSTFRAKIRDQTEGSFTFVYLLWGCSTTLKLK